MRPVKMFSLKQVSQGGANATAEAFSAGLKK
jgi:hypothetical protein